MTTVRTEFIQSVDMFHNKTFAEPKQKKRAVFHYNIHPILI